MSRKNYESDHEAPEASMTEETYFLGYSDSDEEGALDSEVEHSTSCSPKSRKGALLVLLMTFVTISLLSGPLKMIRLSKQMSSRPMERNYGHYDNDSDTAIDLKLYSEEDPTPNQAEKPSEMETEAGEEQETDEELLEVMIEEMEEENDATTEEDEEQIGRSGDEDIITANLTNDSEMIETSVSDPDDTSIYPSLLGGKTLWDTCWEKGQWKLNPNQTYLYEHFYKSYRRCMDQHRSFNYRWYPESDSCQLTELKPDTFCKVVREKNITGMLFAGDSLTFGMFLSQAMVLGLDKYVVEHSTATSKPTYTFCDGHLRMVFMRNDYLKEPVSPRHHAINRRPFMYETNRSHYDVVVLNTGAHYTGDRSYVERMKKLYTYMKSYPEKLFIWRTSVAGHPGCANVRSIPPAETYVPEYTTKQVKWGWPFFYHQNGIAHDVFRSLIGQNLVYMNTRPMMFNRADMHFASGDCLHYCRPGPDDFYAELLMNILQKFR